MCIRDRHAAERNATFTAAGLRQTRANIGKEFLVGRRESHRGHVFLYSRFVLVNRVQTHAERLRVGKTTKRPKRRQPARLPTFALRESPNAFIRSFLRLLHGPGRTTVELQLHGRQALGEHEIRVEVGQS